MGRRTTLSLLLFLGAAAAAASAAAAAAAAATKATPSWTWDPRDSSSRPILIAHRGASGMYPEHTRKAYEAAAEQGADFFECDIEVTKDLELVCSHEPWISGVTNVALDDAGPTHEDFSDRLTTYTIDDDDEEFDWNDKGDITDYFTYDFTLEELLTLRRKQAMSYRDPAYNWEESFVTFREYLQLAKDLGVGAYPEVKHGAATNRIFAARGQPEVKMEELVVQVMSEMGYNDGAREDCYIQSFELETLKLLRQFGSVSNLVFLVGGGSKEKTSDEYLQMYKEEYDVKGLGINKELVVKRTEGPYKHIDSVDEELIPRIHSHGLTVVAYTFRNEPQHLAYEYGQDPYVEYETFLDLGLDGYFTDFPASLRRFYDYKEMEAEITRLEEGSDSGASSASCPQFLLFLAATAAAATVIQMLAPKLN